VAVSKRPAYVNRRKEQQRLARATENREARRARKYSTGTEVEVEAPDTPDQPADLSEGIELDAD
jgi:hypothetical protein